MQKDNSRQKKEFFPISGGLREYLGHYKREMELPVKYENLLQSVDSYPLMNEKNEDTLWQTMVYDQHYGKDIFEGLKQIYVCAIWRRQKNSAQSLYEQGRLLYFWEHQTFPNQNIKPVQ